VQLLNGGFRDPSSQPAWTVTIQAPARSPFDGSAELAAAGSAAWAQQTETALTADGFAGRVEAIHGTAVASRATVATQAQQVGARAAVNAGFFTIDAPLATVAGVPTGLGVYDGTLESLANSARADLVLDGRAPARIENLVSFAQLRAASLPPPSRGRARSAPEPTTSCCSPRSSARRSQREPRSRRFLTATTEWCRSGPPAARCRRVTPRFRQRAPTQPGSRRIYAQAGA
jgi:hypothetical protein